MNLDGVAQHLAVDQRIQSLQLNSLNLVLHVPLISWTVERMLRPHDGCEAAIGHQCIASDASLDSIYGESLVRAYGPLRATQPSRWSRRPELACGVGSSMVPPLVFDVGAAAQASLYGAVVLFIVRRLHGVLT